MRGRTQVQERTLCTEIAAPAPESAPRAPIELVALAASAGGLNALVQLLSALPVTFPAAIVIVQHLDRTHRSYLADILARRTPLPVKQAEDGDRLQPGHVTIAPPDQHLLVRPDRTVALSHAALVHFVRPSADLLFESVAASYKERAVAVVLTGMGCDGARGVQAVKAMGGVVIVQDKASAQFSGMPSAAIATGKADFVLTLQGIAPRLILLAVRGGGS